MYLQTFYSILFLIGSSKGLIFDPDLDEAKHVPEFKVSRSSMYIPHGMKNQTMFGKEKDYCKTMTDFLTDDSTYHQSCSKWMQEQRSRIHTSDDLKKTDFFYRLVNRSHWHIPEYEQTEEAIEKELYYCMVVLGHAQLLDNAYVHGCHKWMNNHLAYMNLCKVHHKST